MSQVVETKFRAMKAKEILRHHGHMNYVPLIVRRHPEANTTEMIPQIHAVANGRKADEQITMWLEELVAELIPQVA